MLTHRNPNTLHIFHTLRDRIRQGVYPAETWLPTERVLAQEFEVDRTVVRSVLLQLDQTGMIIRLPGKRPWVNTGAQIGINQIVSVDSPVEVYTVVAILPHEGHSASSMAILKGINQVLRFQQDEYSLKVEDNYGEDAAFSSTLELRALENARVQNAVGVILWHMSGMRSRDAIDSLTSRGVPVVLIDRIPEGMDCDYVGIDNMHSAQKAVNHLIDLGHKRIGHLTHRDTASTVMDRKYGYLQTLRMRGIPIDESLICSINDMIDTGRNAADYFFSLEDPPTAVFTVNDNVAHGFVSDVEQFGKRVPEDISVIGFDDVERFSRRTAILTTMSQPFEQLGQRAATLILHRLRKESGIISSKQHVLLDTTLVHRKTTAPFKQVSW